MANWFYQTDGKEIGPLNEASLVLLIEAGQVKPTDLIRSEDDPVWVVASMISTKDGAVVRPVAAAPTPPPVAASAPPLPPASQWFYSRSTEGGREGPVSVEALGGLYKKGAISPGTLVWTQGMANWTAISSVSAFEPYKPLKRASTMRPATKKIVAKAHAGSSSRPKTLARSGAGSAGPPKKGVGQKGSVVIKGKSSSPVKKKIKSNTVRRPATKKFKPVQGKKGGTIGKAGKGGALKVPKSGPKVARLVRAPGEPKGGSKPPPAAPASGQANVQQWMYAPHADAGEFGPIPLPNLLRLFADEVLDGDSIVWTEGMVEWAFAKDIPALMDLVKTGG